MKNHVTLIAGLVMAGVISTAVSSAGHEEKAAAAIKARQAAMQLYAFNLGILGGMAKGAVDYDAAVAAGAAGNLASVSHMDQSQMWPPGSDTATLGDTTAALAAIWQAGSTVGEKGKALADATTALEAAAGDGLEALRGAIGPVGQACGACHKAYRQPDS